MKKRALFTLLAGILWNTSYAQTAAGRLATDKGSLFSSCDLLLASFSQNDQFTSESWHYDVALSPRLGYFIMDDLAVGGDLYLNIEGYTETLYRTIFPKVGVFARYYFGNAKNSKGIENKLRFYVEAGGGAGHMFNYYTSSENGVETVELLEWNALQFHLMPGVNYFTSKNVAVNAGLNYTHMHGQEQSGIGSQTGKSFQFSVGLQVYFLRNK
jgi:opacity protein-like surface antigen